MRPKRWNKVSLLSMIAAACIGGLFTIVDPASAAEDTVSIAKLVDTINSRSVVLQEREEAAMQLVNRNSPQATQQADRILKNPANQRGQVAVARALAKSANPDPGLIPDLVNLLTADPTPTQAAASALANYDGHPEVFDALRQFADNTNNAINVRMMVIEAMGSIVEQRVANYLINLLGVTGQSVTIQNAASNALADMTGIRSIGSDVHQWQQWWTALTGKNADQFRSQVLGSRIKQLKQSDTRLVEAAGKVLTNNYYDVLRLDKSAAANLLVSYLSDNAPEIRSVGVDLITTPVNDKSVRRKILSMIDDPDDTVRLRVVNVVLALNDHTALPSLIHQLQIEKNIQIRAKLAQALGKLEDPTAIDAIMGLLQDKQPEIVAAAARALAGNLGSKLREMNPTKADQASAQLRTVLESSTGAGTDDLRAACVSALATLRDKQSFDTFRQRVQPAETSEVRQAALRGFGNLGDTRASSIVLDQLDDGDRKVRYEAATALQTTATPDQAQSIFQRMKHNPADDDPDKEISEALWQAFQNLYAKETTADLNRWATDLTDAPDKRLTTLQKLGDALAAQNDAKGVAENQQEIAEAMMSVKPPRKADAIASLQKALDYWRGPGKGDPDKLEALIDAMLDDELSAGMYTDAVTFAARQIAFNPVYQQTVGPRIQNTAQALSTKNPGDAKVLIDAALQMKPPLDDRYVALLHTIQNEIKQRENAPPG